MAIHFQLDGNIIHVDSEEAKIQLGLLDPTFITEDKIDEVEEEQEGSQAPALVQRSAEPSVIKLVNQFNFCEHASQTYNNASKVDGLTAFLKPIKIVERMINQNTFDDVLQDFAFYEDISDEFRDSLGTLLPLWKFTYEKSRKMVVTALCWSIRYNDLFAVGLGSHDFLKQGGGMICFYSIKNPGYPEYTFRTESGVLCLDIHPEYHSLICVGFYDGSVGVYKLNQEKVGPLYISTAYSNKNTDPVWQVRWLPHDEQPNRVFYSISSDGRVSSWSILKSGVGAFHECPDDITCYDILLMQLPKEANDDPGSLQVSSHESGTALEFHRKDSQIFLIATEEGMIHKCSRTYGSEYLLTLKAHNMAVYRLNWNYFHDDIFITCSADWTVKIWHQYKEDPLFVFDLGAPVGDVAWAPYSSTVFAAVTSDGNVRIYDLNVNKYEPLCLQMVAQKKHTKLTHVAFNPVHPIIICGDDRGQVMSLKLSPNLRKKPKEKKGLEKPDPIKVEIEKMEKLLSLLT
uniref:Dynein intermediate chain n=1 Tax=Echinococcus granulosus TaxID=6210 RepID=A0A068WBB0_ECHGR|nr:Dynein intermediate chain [Echinococcus granulosus]